MNVLGIRFCSVSSQAKDLAQFLAALGLPQQKLDGEAPQDGRFPGAIFPAGLEGDSWVEVWQDGPAMPAGVMLQVVVDDADAFAAHARANGLEPAGPMDAHGERVYFLQGPSGLHVTFQSKLNGQRG